MCGNFIVLSIPFLDPDPPAGGKFRMTCKGRSFQYIDATRKFGVAAFGGEDDLAEAGEADVGAVGAGADAASGGLEEIKEGSFFFKKAVADEEVVDDDLLEGGRKRGLLIGAEKTLGGGKLFAEMLLLPDGGKNVHEDAGYVAAVEVLAFTRAFADFPEHGQVVLESVDVAVP